jgi:hypothetical protein
MTKLVYPDKLSALKKDTPREGFAFEIKMGNQMINSFEFDSIVKSIDLRLSDDKIDSLRIVFFNSHDFLLNDELFKTGSMVELWLGYESFGMRHMGVFVALVPCFNIDSSSEVIVEAYALSSMMAQEEKRFSYHNVTDSKIAQSIADSYKLNADIENTKEVYKLVVQGNQTDYDLLKDLSERNGFLFYVENKTLHFHRKKTQALDFDLAYERDFGKIRNALIRIIGLGKNAIFHVTDIDPATGKIISSKSTFEPDNQTDKQYGVRNVDNYSFRQVRYLVGKGQNNNVSELSRIASSATSASRYSIQLNCNIIGVELVKPAKIINLNGLMRFSGLYYIKECRHYWDADSGYITNMLAYRTFIRPFSGDSVSKVYGYGTKRVKGHNLASIATVGRGV